MRVLKQSTARDVAILMTDSVDHVTGKTGINPLTITLSKATAAFGAITPTVTELVSGWYKLALTASHTDTLGDFALHITGSGADPSDIMMQVVAYDPSAAPISATVTSPLAADGTLTLVRGDDYYSADSRSIDFAFVNAPSLTGGTVKLTLRAGNRGPVVYTGAVLTATSARFELSAAQTGALEVGDPAYVYDVQVALVTTGHIVTLQLGTVTVEQDVTP